MACRHPVDVALHGVDLAIVGDHAERMGQIPCRESVGGETLVYKCQGGNHAFVLQVLIVDTDFVRQQHAFIDDGA